MRTANELLHSPNVIAGSPSPGEPAFVLQEAAKGLALLVLNLVTDGPGKERALARIEEALLHATSEYRGTK